MARKLKINNKFEFKPFSKKQLKVLTWWMDGSPYKDYDGIIADGSVRSGKTVSMGLSYVTWATETFNGYNFGLCGKTHGSLMRNVVNELLKMLRSDKHKKYSVEHNRTDNQLIIRGWSNKYQRYHTNIFYLFGGKDEGSQDLVQGITLAGCLFDEVVLMPESFVNQATARCSVDGAKMWFNDNPEGPYHYFKLNWVDQHEEKQLLYLHFTMDDNLSLSEQVKNRYKKMYTGIFYKRYILGLWVLAEGVIYDMFDTVRHTKPTPDYTFYYDYKFIACDYGTQNPCTFGMYGVKGDTIHLMKTYYYDGRNSQKQKTDSEYAQDMVDWIGPDDLRNKRIKFVLVDPSAASFIAELMNSKYGLPDIMKASNAVLDGIRLVSQFLGEDKFTIDPSCEEDIREFNSYLWDPKAAARGIDAPIKENDHCMDRNRYAIYTVFGGYMNLHYDDQVYDKGEGNPYKKLKNKFKNSVF